jgi:hypothetical protein
MLAKVTMIVAGTIASAHAQLHLITGSVVPASPQKFGAALIEVRDDGSLRPLAEIVPPCREKVCVPGAGGIDWITVSYGAGIAVFKWDKLEVLDLPSAAVVKSCPPPASPPGSSWLGQWVLNTPSNGPVLALNYWEPDNRRSFLQGFRLDRSIACASSVVKLDPIDLRYISALGGDGIARIGISDGINIGVSLDARGDLMNRFGGTLVPYGYHVPAGFLEEATQSYRASIRINNPEVMVLGISGQASTSSLLAFRKRDQVWRRVPLPTQRLPSGRTRPAGLPIRGFGHFLAIVEAQPKGGQNTASLGSAEWRKGASRMGPDLAYFLSEFEDVYPGRLHLYDVETERSYMIDTKQADSEILLVENNAIYYRVSDRLYSVPITPTGLGRSRLLATDDLIRDAHWALIKP